MSRNRNKASKYTENIENLEQMLVNFQVVSNFLLKLNPSRTRFEYLGGNVF